MANKVLAMCRGILYCYVALELDELEPHTAPGATFACDGLEIPVPIYPLEQTLGIAPRQWVAVFPHMRRDGQELTVADKVTGQPLLVHGFDYADMKWQSRLAYRLKKSLATRMRDIERVYWSTGILIELTDIISASDDEDVMRFDIMFPQGFGEATVDPARVLALGSCSQAIVMEDCLGDDGKRHVYLSMRVPHDDAQTLVLAQDSDDAGCQPGLLVIDAPMRADKARETWEKMASACDDPTYPHWLIRHRAQGFELCAQREEGREWSVGALVIVDAAQVLYAESVDGACFLYGADSVIECPLRLADLEERLAGTEFVRASRTLLVNFDHVRALRPYPGARLELVPANGESVIASRQFAPAFRAKIGL